MHSFLPVICLSVCMTITVSESQYVGANYKSDSSVENGHPPKRRTYKSRDDIPSEELESMKRYFHITDPPPKPTKSVVKEEDSEAVSEHDVNGVQDIATPATTESLPSTVSASDNNETDASENNSTCSSCDLREEDKQMRIASIKNEILSKIGFQSANLPNMTRNLPRIPSIERLIESYQMQGDDAFIPNDDYLPEDDYYGQIQKAYTISQSAPESLGPSIPGVVYFDISDSIRARKIQNATLWVYLKRPHGGVDKAIEMYMYVIPTKGKRHKVLQGPRRYKKATTYGWHEFEVGHIVDHWLKHPQTNKGVLIEAIDSHGRNLVGSPDNEEDGNYVPTLEMNTVEHSYWRRRRRNAPMICDEEKEIEECCRYPLRVDFVEFGWDWVIAPTGYVANYCSGECRHQHLNTHPQSYLIQQTAAGNRDGGPCCTPSTLFPLAMLYFDHNHNVLYTYMQRMIVQRCGCA